MSDSKSQKEWTTKDSGNRRTFNTGAQRDRASGKGRFDLVSPFAIQRLCGVYERGAAKYEDRNYEKGMPLGQFLDSCLRHIFQLMEGKEDEDHAGQALWNIASFIHIKEMIDRGLLPESLDDLPCYMPANGKDDEWRQRNRVSEGFLHPPAKEVEHPEAEDNEEVAWKFKIGQRCLTKANHQIVILDRCTTQSTSVGQVVFYIDTDGVAHNEVTLTAIND
jgi:hypothetical protein